MSETEESAEEQIRRVMDQAIAAEPPTLPREGLQLLFQVGDLLPMNGIWFEIEDVSPTRLRLRPREMTAARRKEIAHGRE